MVLNQLAAGPQTDSFMADEAEGSGEGSGDGSSRPSGWDDDDNADEYSSGDGSGEDPITTQLPGAADPKGIIALTFSFPYCRPAFSRTGVHAIIFYGGAIGRKTLRPVSV